MLVCDNSKQLSCVCKGVQHREARQDGPGSPYTGPKGPPAADTVLVPTHFKYGVNIRDIKQNFITGLKQTKALRFYTDLEKCQNNNKSGFQRRKRIHNERIASSSVMKLF